jgi:predicted enzyme related to lactoylglutathione lyase
MNITGVLIRRAVDDLATAVPFYEKLTGTQAHRFRFANAELAAVGPFLLLTPGQGAERLANVAATITVDDLSEAQELLSTHGAEIVAPVAATPNGRRLIARHPDGAVFEYVSR